LRCVYVCDKLFEDNRLTKFSIWDTRGRSLAKCPIHFLVISGKRPVGEKSEKTRGRRTIKQLKRSQNSQAARGFVRQKRTVQNKEKGQKNAVDSNARPRTRGPCSPGHSGPQTPRNTFLESLSLSEALKSGLFGPAGYQYRRDRIRFTIDEGELL